MDFGTKEGLDVSLGWSEENMASITKVALVPCPTARKASP